MAKETVNIAETANNIALFANQDTANIIIEKYNKPQAAIVPYSEYEAFEEWEIAKETELMKKLIKSDTGIRYNWEDIKKELFENVPAKPFRRTKKVSKKSKR